MDRNLSDLSPETLARGDDIVSYTVLEDLERQYFAVREERDRLENELAETKEKLVGNAGVTIERLQRELEIEAANKTAAHSKILSLEEEIKLARERVDRSQAEGDRLREELSRLSEQNAEKTKIISSLETQTQLKDSEAIPLFHETQRLRTEVDSLQAHSKWLEKELQQKSEDYNRLQQESRDRSAQLSMQIDQMASEKRAVDITLDNAKETETSLHEKVDQLSRDLLSTKQELLAIQENCEDQLREEKRLVQLQKDHLERWQQRYNDVVRQNEGMKEAAAKAMEANQEEINQVRRELEAEYEQLLDNQKNEYVKKLAELDRNTLTSIRTGKQLLMSEDEVDEEEPMSLTDLYTRLEETKQALHQEKIQSKYWQMQFKQVEQDILDSRPKMLRQLEEYELAVDKLTDYEQRLRQAILERETAREEVKSTQQEISTIRHVLATKKKESEELAKQVQGLLISRSGGQVESDIPLSIQQMQNQNQRLLAEQHRLNMVIEELQRKLDTDDLQRKLEDLESELGTLRQEQQNQEALATQLAMQRDLYKSLLASKDESISCHDEADALTVIKQQVDRSRCVEERNKDLEDQLASVKADLNFANREREGMSERIERYETVLSELRNSVDSMERQLVAHRSEAARKAAECDYQKEKSERLEAALERSRSEAVSIMNAKNNLEQINAELQRSLSQVNSSLGVAEDESRRSESKLRLLQTQFETTKAFEARLVEENNQLRADIARHGSLNENLRRIEATLATKAGDEKEKLNEEITRLSSQLLSERSKYSGDIEILQGKIAEGDARVKDLESLCSKAQADLLKAEKTSLETKAELFALSSKYKSLESQLELTTKKLGEGSFGDADDVAFKARIDSLMMQMEAKDVELAALTEKVKTYEKLSKDSEAELVSLKALTDENVAKQMQEIAELEQKVKNLSALNSSKQEIIQDLTNDLAGHRDERNQLESKLTAEISSIQATLESRSKDLEGLKEANITLKLDIESLRNEVVVAQTNYERELGLHAQARSLLRDFQERINKEEHLSAQLKGQIEVLQKEGESQRAAWAEERSSLEESYEQTVRSLNQAREQNTILYTQVERLRAIAEKGQSESLEENEGSEPQRVLQQKEMSELRELVRFLRSENELILTELDSTKRAVERERSASNVVKRNLDQARAELNVLLSDSREISGQDTETLRKVQDMETQVKVLTDSNKLMREEKERLQQELVVLQKEVEKSKNSLKPSEVLIRDLQVEVATLGAERDGLKKDLDTWKDRVQNLVAKFNQIDPEEHSRLKEKINEMEAEKESLNAWKKATEEESLRIRNIAKNLNQKAREQKALIDEKTKEVEKLKAENDQLNKEKTSDSKIIEEHQDLKVTVDRLRKDAASHKTQLDGANEQNNRLRETLRKFQSTIRELKDNEKKLSDELTTLKDASGGSVNNETLSGSSKLHTNQGPSKQDEPVEQMPSIPDEGFHFGPSDDQGQSQQVDETKKGLVQRSEDAVTTLEKLSSESKPQSSSETTIFSATSQMTAPPTSDSISDTIKSTSQASQAIRRMSGDTKELSMKEKLIEKKRKLEEAKLRKRKLEMEAAQKAQTDSSDILEKRAKISGSPVDSGTALQKSLEPSEPLSQDGQIEAESRTDEIDDVAKESEKVSSDNKKETKKMIGATSLSAEQTDNPVTSRSGASLAFGTSAANQTDNSGTALNNTESVSTPFGSGSGTSFLDMKPPGSSSSIAFSFGTSSFKLPTPAQPAPAPAASPFNAFASATNPFSSFGSPSVPASQSIFDNHLNNKSNENDGEK